MLKILILNRKQSATPEGRNLLNTKFKLCANLTKPEDIKELNGMIRRLGFDFIHCIFFDQFLDYLTDVYGNLAMVNYPYNTSFLAPLPPNPVTEFCSRINSSYNDIQLLDVRHASDWCFSINKHLLRFTGSSSCIASVCKLYRPVEMSRH